MYELCYIVIRASQWMPSLVGHLLVLSAVKFVSTHYGLGVHLNIIETP